MRKTLLYSLLITLTSLWTGAVKANEVTIDFTQKGYDNAEQVIKLTQDGISLEFDKGENSNTPKYYTDGTAVRCYGGNWFSVTAASATITKIVFTFASGGGSNAITADAGTFSTNTWTGSSSSVKFTIGGTKGHRRIQKMVVTTGESGDTRTDANLSFSTNTASATVGEDFTPPTLNNPNNVSVYYSSSNDQVATVEPDGEVTLVGAGTTTITASVYESDKVYKGSASYTLTVTAMATLPFYAPFGGNLHDFTTEGSVTWTISSDNDYVKATAGSKRNAEGWLISPVIDMTDATRPVMEFEHAGKFFGNMQEEATLWASVDGESWEQITIPTYFTNNDWKFVTTQIDLQKYAGKKVRFGFKYVSTTAAYGTWEIKNFKVNDGEIVITYDDMTVAELCELTKAQDNINLTFTDALVTYVQEKSAYIREGENAICAYDLGIDLKKGQTINGPVKVDFELYRGMHEIKANTATTDSELTITDAAAGATVAPTEATLSELLKGKHAADYIVLRGVQIISEEAAPGAKGLNGATAETPTYYAADEADAKIQLFSPSDDITAKANNGKKYDIEAIFAGAETNKMNITPLAISETTAINNITTDEALKQNAPIYNLAGQRVGESYKGIVIVNGKKIKK